MHTVHTIIDESGVNQHENEESIQGFVIFSQF